MFNTMKDLMSFEECVCLMNPKKYADATINDNGMVDFNREGKSPWGVRYKVSNQEFGVLAGKSLNPLIYRGENNEYDKFIPSVKRGDYTNLDERRKKAFVSIYQKTPYFYFGASYKDCFGYHMEVDLEAVSQHYGFKTNYIDVTRLREVAEFFAYTYYDKGEYHPITDFSIYSPRLYTADLHDVYREKPKSIKLISGQIVLRPCNQAAMAIDVLDDFDCKGMFQKEILPKDANKAREIYERYYRQLFPKKDVMSEIANMLLMENIEVKDLDGLIYKSEEIVSDLEHQKEMENDVECFSNLLESTNSRGVSTIEREVTLSSISIR